MPKRLIFDDLPVGACFAFSATSSHATRRKLDTHHVVVIPGGKRPLRVEDIEASVHAKPCHVSLGRRRKRNKRRR